MNNSEKQKELAGKTALVTGGSRGIGRAIVLRLAAKGVAYIGVHFSNDQEAANETIKMAQKLGTRAVAIQSDFAPDGHAGAQKLWHTFERQLQHDIHHSGLDILVNCAGIAPLVSLPETSIELYQETMSINLAATLFLIQAAESHMRNGGRIINLSSALTRIADPNRALYAASKGAINALTLALAPLFGAKNITVNAIAPGVIDTDMNKDWLHDTQAHSQAADLSVFSRLGHPYDVADVVTFLASDDSRWITGQIIDVSGGSAL